MKRIIGLSVLLAILLTCFACKEHDPSYDDVVFPEIKAESVITGCVTDFKGEKLADAVIVVNLEDEKDTTQVKTDEDGIYTYKVPKIGTYELRATFPGKLVKRASMYVSSVKTTQKFVQNFILPEDRTIVLKTGDNNLETETIRDNEPNGTVIVTASIVIEDTQLPGNAELTLTPVYSSQDGEDMAKGLTKATIITSIEDKMLAGVVLSCSDSTFTELAKEAKMKFSVVKEVQEVTKLMMFDLKSDEWVELPYESHDDEIVFDVIQLTSYGIFGEVHITAMEASQEITYFKPTALWNNFYGAVPLHVGEVTYKSKLGVTLDRKQGKDQLLALLLEKLAMDYGVNSTQEITSVYDINGDVPVGMALKINGNQFYQIAHYGMNGKQVNATVWGTTYITGMLYNRSHTGGGNYVIYY